jgi:hypothetical protein
MADMVDPNEVRMTGENSFIRLAGEQGGTETTRASHWRILYSPGGQGHALFLQSDVTDGDVRIYSDNIAVARWLQDEMESMFFPAFTDQTIPVAEAEFTASGDGINHWTETIESPYETVSMAWHDFVEPFVIQSAPNARPGRPLGIYSTFVPARKAQLTLNGEAATGTAQSDKLGDAVSSTCCLAWSESWMKER